MDIQSNDVLAIFDFISEHQLQTLKFFAMVTEEQNGYLLTKGTYDGFLV